MIVKTRISILVVFFLILLAVLPWIIVFFASQPLLPEELRQERSRYETRVATAQDATIEAMRQATSAPEVIVIGTVLLPNTSATETIAPDDLTMSTATTGSQTAVSIVTPITTPDASVQTETTIIIHTDAAATLPSSTSAPMTASSTVTSTIPLPSGLVDTVDVITEMMLVEQVKQDTDDIVLSNLIIHLSSDGIYAVSEVNVVPGMNQRFEAYGEFTIANHSLVIRFNSIFLDGDDITESSRAWLESGVNSSLYNLLPERYVQDYRLAEGEILVYSKVKP